MNAEQKKEHHRKYMLQWLKNNPEQKIKKVKQFHNWYLKNQSYSCKRVRDYYKTHRKELLVQQKRYNQAHPEKINEQHRRSRMKNFEQYHTMAKRWRAKNVNKVREYKRRDYIKFCKNKNRKLNHQMGIAICKSLRGIKNKRHWENLVGYTIRDLRKHLESKFINGMTWDNYGQYGWHIDHVIPKSRFHFKTAEDADFKVCWSLANLQPLWWYDNLSKNSKTMEEWKKAV